jgi:hypothetical protein
MSERITNYNDLKPPENPLYPWVPENWQLLCYYCAQPIYETSPVAGFRQRTCYMRGHWRHMDTDEIPCVAQHVRPSDEIDPPRCHVCKVQPGEGHKSHCSFRGIPQFTATPMSSKEDELISIFGWDGKGVTK